MTDKVHIHKHLQFGIAVLRVFEDLWIFFNILHFYIYSMQSFML